MKKVGLFLILLIAITLQANAVLKEQDLTKTLSVLRLELEHNYKEQKYFMQMYEQQSNAQHAKLINYMKQSEQISLMLYSQKADFTFDVAYACTQASELYRQLNTNIMPYEQISKRLKDEIARYDSLILSLKELPPSIDETPSTLSSEDSLNMSIIKDTPDSKAEVEMTRPFMLNDLEQRDREECLIYAKAIMNNLKQIQEKINQDNHYYQVVKDKVERLNAYTQQRYKALQKSIFKDGGTNYFTVLRQLPRQLSRVKRDFEDKYRPFGKGQKFYSEWRGSIVLFMSVFMLVYIFIATLLSNLILRGIPSLVKKFKPTWANKMESRLANSKIRYRSESFKARQRINTLILGIFIFAIAIMIVRQFMSKNLMIMATDLMIDFAWLIEAILLSLLFRLKPNQTKKGVSIYMPFLWMALVIIFFRIVLIPNNLVSLICPPILLGFTIWQFFAIKRCKKHLPLSDTLYSGISLIVMVVSCVCSWAGFTLLAVQIIIWWTFQLAAIQTITCCYDLMEMYERERITKRILKDATTFSEQKEIAEGIENGNIYKSMKKGNYIQKTWLHDLVNMALIPIAAVLSVLMSIYWAADIFEMTATCEDIFKKVLFYEPNLVKISLDKLTIVICSFFLFKYINHLVRSIYHQYRIKKSEEKGGDFNETLAKNIIAILVWGVYIIFSLVLLEVPRSGIEIVGAGLATGMGFAMKDLLENFFYGISLMSGRLRVGDYIECDGIEGKVESITYQSTQIITLDGSVIAFLNTSLFNKNFKNMTRNHSYELITIPVSVAYGTDVEHVRKILINAIKPMCKRIVDGREIVNPEKTVSVLFSDFGDSSVNLLVAIWPLVDQKIMFIAEIKEVIYQTLNKNGIEIPFPQQDVYIRSIANQTGGLNDKDS